MSTSRLMSMALPVQAIGRQKRQQDEREERREQPRQHRRHVLDDALLGLHEPRGDDHGARRAAGKEPAARRATRRSMPIAWNIIIVKR